MHCLTPASMHRAPYIRRKWHLLRLTYLANLNCIGVPLTMGKFSDEFKLFFQTVSIRGVPRIFTSKQIIIAIFWLLTVLLCFGILLWQLCLLLIKYFAYPYSTTSNEESSHPIFPAVSICNLNPVLMVTSQFTSMLTWSQHLKNVQNALNNVDYGEIAAQYRNMPKDDIQRIIRDLQTAGGYFSNFPIYEPQKADSRNDMIVDYSLTDWNWMRTNSNVTITPYWDSNYYNCFRLTMDENSANNVQMMSIVVYINNFPSTNLPGTYQLGGTSSRAVGVSLRIHFPGTKGNMKQGINLSPGTESTFFVDMVNRTRLKYPYNKWNCTNNEYLNITGYLYNINDCIELCIQEQIVNSCRCISINHIFSNTQLIKANRLLCGNMSNFGDGFSQWDGPKNTGAFYANKTQYSPDFLKRLACLNSINTSSNDDCFNKCLLPCREVIYKHNGMSADWPDITNHLGVYRKYIRQPVSRFINQSNFERYRQLDEMSRTMQMDDEEIIAELKKLTGIRENFLQINVAFESRYSHQIADTETISSQSLLSSIGGALSLWLGLSFMTIAELVEFILRLINITIERKQRTADVAPSKESTSF